ncbi:MAG: (2Fe-2S) ferredoxin domain-containing protein [Cyanobacteriota bacterium]|nr:(2Fe-2S) ferredoxin domain-containing protein [Cyanobacteriota bacterium]
MTTVAHHLLLCATPSKPLCCDPALGAATWARLKELVRTLGLEEPNRPEGVVLRTKADCLRVCQEGPILLIWPEGIVYGGVTPERVERIVREHLLEGRPIEPWIIGRHLLKWFGQGAETP